LEDEPKPLKSFGWAVELVGTILAELFNAWTHPGTKGALKVC
jgi:hypothetical protein